MKHIRIGAEGLECIFCNVKEKVVYPIETSKLEKQGEEFKKKHLHIQDFCITCHKPIKFPNDLWCDKCFENNLK